MNKTVAALFWRKRPNRFIDIWYNLFMYLWPLVNPMQACLNNIFEYIKWNTHDFKERELCWNQFMKQAFQRGSDKRLNSRYEMPDLILYLLSTFKAVMYRSISRCQCQLKGGGRSHESSQIDWACHLYKGKKIYSTPPSQKSTFFCKWGGLGPPSCSGFTPDSVLCGHSWWCLGDTMWCQGSKWGQMHSRQVPYPLNYHPSFLSSLIK